MNATASRSESNPSTSARAAGPKPAAPPTAPFLLVEDSEDDLFFFRRLMAKAGFSEPFEVAADGEQAIDLLARKLSATGAGALPRLIFLDLKLPLRSGFEVLTWIRQQPQLGPTVVIVLSSSAEIRDVSRAYELGAQSYVVKYPAPVVFQEIMQAVAALPKNGGFDGLVLPGLKRP
jgi:CheY-like chemotaxis protein